MTKTLSRRLTPIQRRHVVLLWRSGEGVHRLAHVYRRPVRMIEDVIRRSAR